MDLVFWPKVWNYQVKKLKKDLEILLYKNSSKAFKEIKENC